MLDAMSEHDALGKSAFLAKYGFGQAKSYFVEHDGKFYDSKAIAGIALGKQFPDRGPLKNTEFSGGSNIKDKLQSLGFEFGDDVEIAASDIALFRSSKKKSKYADLTDAERDAYIRITKALKFYGNAVVDYLGSDEYEVLFTSGFHLRSGIRGYVPKDLWFGVYAKENGSKWVGCPQIFMIVSERGIEFGFGPSTHPSGFSNSSLKSQMRTVAPQIYSLLPAPTDELALNIAQKLSNDGNWYFRTQTRLTPNQNDQTDFTSWLRYLKSPEGGKNAGGSVSQYLAESVVDSADLHAASTDMAAIFGPLMKQIRSSKLLEDQSEIPDENSVTFANSLSSALAEFERVREGPYRREETLWSLMDCPPSAFNRQAGRIK